MIEIERLYYDEITQTNEQKGINANRLRIKLLWWVSVKLRKLTL